MTITHAIVFSLTLTVVCAMPPSAGAHFDLDLQATEIGNQLQEILNRITRYTALLSQFTRLDCSAQGMAAGAQATPINEAAVVCDSLNMLGAFRDSCRQLLQAPTDLLNTAPPLPDRRDVLQAADTVTEADIRNVYPDGAGAADAAVATFERRRNYADRSVVLAHAQADAAASLAATAVETQEKIDTVAGENNVSTTALQQAVLAGNLSQGQLLAALAQMEAWDASAAAADAYNAEVARRQIEAQRLANRAALEAQWALERVDVAARANERIESMYGGYQLPSVFNRN